MGQPISMKLDSEVGLGEIFQKPKWLCRLPFRTKVSGNHLRPPNREITCSYRGTFGIA